MQIVKDMIMDWGVMESASSINSNFVDPQATLKKSGFINREAILLTYVNKPLKMIWLAPRECTTKFDDTL